MMDSLYLLGILFILASLLLGIRTAWVAREQSATVAIGSDERMLAVFLVAFTVAFGAVLALYLFF